MLYLFKFHIPLDLVYSNQNFLLSEIKDCMVWISPVKATIW